jgi:hypothetical protein
MSSAQHDDLAHVLHGHMVKHIRRKTASQRSEIGRVTQADPEVKIFFQEANLELPAEFMYFTDACPLAKLRTDDIVAATTVGGQFVVHDVIRFAHATVNTGLVSGSTVLAEIDSTGLSSSAIDALFVRPPPDHTLVSDPTNHLLLVRQGGLWRKTAALTVIP